MKKSKYTEEQMKVINNSERLLCLSEALFDLASYENIPLSQKKVSMVQHILLYMKLRKNDFLSVGIKSQVADKLVKNEIKTLEETTKELKNVIS